MREREEIAGKGTKRDETFLYWEGNRKKPNAAQHEQQHTGREPPPRPPAVPRMRRAPPNPREPSARAAPEPKPQRGRGFARPLPSLPPAPRSPLIFWLKSPLLRFSLRAGCAVGERCGGTGRRRRSEESRARCLECRAGFAPPSGLVGKTADAVTPNSPPARVALRAASRRAEPLGAEGRAQGVPLRPVTSRSSARRGRAAAWARAMGSGGRREAAAAGGAGGTCPEPRR